MCKNENAKRLEKYDSDDPCYSPMVVDPFATTSFGGNGVGEWLSSSSRQNGVAKEGRETVIGSSHHDLLWELPCLSASIKFSKANVAI